MSFFKRFSDALVAFCTLCGIISILRAFVDFPFTEEQLTLGLTQKVKIFLSPDVKGEPRHIALFVGLMLVSFIVGRLFARIPVLPLIVSALPFFHAQILFFEGRLETTPIFFVLCLAIAFLGALYDSLCYDTSHSLTLTHHASALLGAIFGALLLLLPKLADKHAKLAELLHVGAEDPSKIATDRIELIGIDLFSELPADEIALLTTLFWLVIVSLVLSYLLRGAYFVDLLLSMGILIFVIFKWHAGVLDYSAAPVIALAVIYFCSRAAVFFGEPEPKPTIKNLISKLKKEKVTAEE